MISRQKNWPKPPDGFVWRTVTGSTAVGPDAPGAELAVLLTIGIGGLMVV